MGHFWGESAVFGTESCLDDLWYVFLGKFDVSLLNLLSSTSDQWIWNGHFERHCPCLGNRERATYQPWPIHCHRVHAQYIRCRGSILARVVSSLRPLHPEILLITQWSLLHRRRRLSNPLALPHRLPNHPATFPLRHRMVVPRITTLARKSRAGGRSTLRSRTPTWKRRRR